MALYKNISRVYDIIFPENRSATEFLSKGLTQKSRILDLACGTGTYSDALARLGHTVVGLDLDEAMIEAARSKYQGKNVSFIAGDMLAIDTLLPDVHFDMVSCIGNSLVHMPDIDSVRQVAEKVYGLLSQEGIFIVQIVNYDRIIKYNIHSLPPIEKKEEGVRFIRKYEFTGNLEFVNFNTELHYDGKKITNSVKLLALQSTDLINIIQSAGFSKIQLFDGYDESEHTDESMATVVKAIKTL